ncbi:tripartite tricarboxylate transporter substrate binding protein [Bordetella tumulicola]|uniref:tripartite tricarboxylate transporter substrate binding protein n=1 Tax=Bordetella tumulicola TaxID=1649133 RepID=UPI0039EFEB9D
MRKHPWLCLAAVLCLTVAQESAHAAWPDDRPIEIVVGFAAGGTTDVMTRTLAPYIQKHLGGKSQLVIVNRPGASGELAVSHMQRSDPNGYTTAIVNLPGYFFLPMYRKAAYDPAKIQLVARVMSDPTVLVARKDKGPHDFKQMIQQLSAQPGTLSAGHNGIGTNGHLAMLSMQDAANVQFNAIPFKGTAEQKVNLGGGHIDLAFVSASEVQNADSEAVPLQLLAQFVPQRLPSLPQVPTTFENGLSVEMTAERGFAMPEGVPAEIVARLQKSIKDAMADPEYLKAAKVDAPFLAFLAGDEWEKRIAEEQKRYRKQASEVQQ